MKKTFLLSLCAALILSMSACGEKDNTGNETPVTEESSDLALDETELGSSDDMEQENIGQESPFAFDPAASFFAEDETIKITIDFEKETYTLDDLIPVYITLTNQSESTVAFVHGSGSNIVPDALDLQLGGLAGLFYPEIMTMDYRVTTLDPGQSTYLECNFAPYLSTDDTVTFGTDKDLDYFKEGGFTAASAGEIDGSISLSYAVLDDESAESALLMGFEEEDMITLSGTFSVTIEDMQD